jgi:hypothetical protein
MGICAAKNPASDAKLKEEKQKSKDLKTDCCRSETGPASE